MQVVMAGLDYDLAPLELREGFSFTRAAVGETVARMTGQPGVLGAVLLSTCNRTELYLSLEPDNQVEPDRLLCQGAGQPYQSAAFVVREGEEAMEHLMEVASGLRSQILGEDQILTQVKQAAELAREVGACDSVLSTLFRTAAACGKQVKTGGRLTGVPTSAAHLAVEAARNRLGELEGREALVIGNGEMGRLAAGLLRDAGCRVTVTLRTYRHGETVVPAGCAVASYDRRYEAMAGKDLVVSATTSPHHTISQELFLPVPSRPGLLIDLAVPRDIQPQLAQLPEVELLNVDHLGRGLGADEAALARARGIIQEHLDRFRQWAVYRDSMPALEEVKQALRCRMEAYLDEDMAPREAAELAIDKVVDLLAGGMTEGFTAQALQQCAAKIRLHTR